MPRADEMVFDLGDWTRDAARRGLRTRGSCGAYAPVPSSSRSVGATNR